MLDCFSIMELQQDKQNTKYHLGITDIPEVWHQTVIDMAEACCCHYEQINSTTIHASGSYTSILVLEQEVTAIGFKLAFLENCLKRSIA